MRALAIADAQVVAGVRAARRSDLVEVAEEIPNDRKHVVVRRATPKLFVVLAEYLLGQLEHARKISLRNAQQRHDHVERVVHRDLLHEIALRSGAHLVHVPFGEFVDTALRFRIAFGAEPVRADGPHPTVVRTVHVDQ